MLVQDNARLPKTVKPVCYDLVFEPDLENFIFRGMAQIDVLIAEDVSSITLHAKELSVDYVILQRDGKAFVPSVVFDQEAERVIFVFSENISAGDVRLLIRFQGVLNDQMAGFYRSVYEVSGEKRIMATTQFEDTSARRAFPCWDEPAIKARFKVTLKIPKHLQAVSNMPAVSEKLCRDKKIIRFGVTPLMSTYLLAFVVGELEHIEATTKDGILVRVFTTPGKKAQGEFALYVGVKALEFYNDYFGIAYPLPKMDMAAIPDFAAGAMENWGLITYREFDFLIDPKNSSSARHQRVAIVVAHEIAHQWFGNLVTMEWWTQLWLNEGFASWMEYFAVDHVFPEWNIWEQFMSDAFASALALDGLRSTHPIETVIKHPSEIGQTFDAISYEKGACVIRMIHDYIGAENFRNGLKLYLIWYAYGNAVTEDLWQALEEVSGKPVRKIMDTWTKQPGYPLISLKQTSDGKFELEQSRFLSSGEKLSPEEASELWQISLPFQNAAGDSQKVLLSDRASLVKLPSDHGGWFKLNAGQMALARVNYTPELWDRLKKALRRGLLSVVDRAGLANDIYALTESGVLPATQLLSVLTAYQGETEYIVWDDIVGSLGGINLLLPNGGVRANFDSFARDLLSRIVAEKGWEENPNETHSQKLLRPMVLSATGFYGDVEVIEEAKNRFRFFLKDPETLDPNLRSMVYGLIARYGDTRTLETLIECYRKVPRQEEKMRFLVALAQFQDMRILEEALKFAFSDEVRSQDLGYFVGSIGRDGQELMWRELQVRFPELMSRYDGKLSGIIRSTIEGFGSEEKAREVEEFFRVHPVPAASQAISQGLERIRARAAWIARDLPAITAWLEKWSFDNILK
ncbi:MAG: M1 family metallopeptidase [Candidatus Niyogibacteria bacterium]|nr:M1 family metallopeptidase [Candidatus Niyogibacteria bacterium]